MSSKARYMKNQGFCGPGTYVVEHPRRPPLQGSLESGTYTRKAFLGLHKGPQFWVGSPAGSQGLSVPGRQAPTQYRLRNLDSSCEDHSHLDSDCEDEPQGMAL